MTRKFRRTNRRSIFAEFRVEFRAEVDGVVKRAVGDVESGIELGIDGFGEGLFVETSVFLRRLAASGRSSCYSRIDICTFPSFCTVTGRLEAARER